MFPFSSLSGASLLLAVVSAGGAVAAPSGTVQRRQSGGQGSQSGGSLTPQVWIPAVIVVLFLLIVFTLLWTRKSMLNRLRRITGNTSQNASRQVTASQLTGDTAANSGGTTGRTARPGRRTRRTPSQISTASLPVYMKEPGEHELVIIRGPEDMVDPMDATSEGRMPVVNENENEHETESPRSSMDMDHTTPMPESALYTPMPHTNFDMPLLSNDSRDQSNIDVGRNPDDSTQNLMNADSNRSPVRPSFDTGLSSSESGSALLRTGGNAHRRAMSDERGEAPPYFEVGESPILEHEIASDEAQSPTDAPSRTAVSASDTSNAASNPDGLPAEPNNRRRSGFRSFFNTFALRPPVPPLPTADPGNTRHRPSHSGSGSALGSVPFRTLSRTRSNNTLASAHRAGAGELTSPSMISLNSISAPLAHTLVRTDFRYPKGGPTPEQIRLISSRESLGRFGVPYGADAIAHAAAASRLDLEPPPEFESSVPEASSSRDATSPGGISIASPVTDERHEEINRRSMSMTEGASGGQSADEEAPSREPSHGLEEESRGGSQEQLSRSPTAPPDSGQLSLAPSSFKAGPYSARPASRASSTGSFATAEESMEPPSPLTPTVHVSEPSSSSARTVMPEVSAPPSLIPSMPHDTLITAVPQPVGG